MRIAYRAVGIALVVVGAAVAANALVSGPHAFAYGTHGVVAMVLCGLGLIGAGIWSIGRRAR